MVCVVKFTEQQLNELFQGLKERHENEKNSLEMDFNTQKRNWEDEKKRIREFFDERLNKQKADECCISEYG